MTWPVAMQSGTGRTGAFIRISVGMQRQDATLKATDFENTASFERYMYYEMSHQSETDRYPVKLAFRPISTALCQEAVGVVSII